MKIFLTGLRISIAGAKLSHLVQKDKIWDHGSMTEQVKNIFYHVEKAKYKADGDLIRSYLTAKAHGQVMTMIVKGEDDKKLFKNAVLTQVSIIEVSTRSKKNPDRFTAFIKGKRKAEENFGLRQIKNENFGIENFSEKWFFIRQGDWWVLDEMKRK